MNTVTYKYNLRCGWIITGIAATYTGAMSEELHLQIDRAIPWFGAIVAAVPAFIQAGYYSTHGASRWSGMMAIGYY